MILVLALLGLAAATASYAYAVSVPYIDPLNEPTPLTVSWILCPPLLFFGWDGFIVSAIIGVLEPGQAPRGLVPGEPHAPGFDDS
jgi:hypothetical protein